MPSWWNGIFERTYTTTSNAAIGIVGSTQALGAGGVIYLGYSDDVDNNWIGVLGSQAMTFGTNTVERMRIDSNGDVSMSHDLVVDGFLGVNATPTDQFEVESSSATKNAARFVYDGGNSSYGCTQFRLLQTSPHFAQFIYQGSEVGSIVTGGSSTIYLTSSDYRLKENIVEMTGALDRVSQLQPKRFNFISTPEDIVDGFLAHEVSDIVPEAIRGTKDEVDAEGNPIYQGIDQSKLVPLLVGAIQELKAEIETLKAQINN